MLELTFATERRTQLLDITSAVRDAIPRGERDALTLFVPHTTAGLLLQATGPGATEVASDLEAAFERLIDETWDWKHASEGDRNPWSHARAALTASSLTIPLSDGRLALGELQAIFLCEFDGPRERRIVLTLI